MKAKEPPCRKTKSKRSSLTSPNTTHRKENQLAKNIPQKEKPRRKKASTDETKVERNSSKTLRKNNESEWVTLLSLKSTLTDSEPTRKQPEKRKSQEYLFLGQQFYLVEQSCPSQRLLHSFRQACSDSSSSKFLQQDPVRTRNEPKRNIFQAARREIELKERHAKARLIQQWWRRLKRANNPENQSQDQQNRVMGRTQPKKIEFHSEEMNQLQFYSLPQLDGNPHEEEAVFESYARFRLEEVGQEEEEIGQEEEVPVVVEGTAGELMREFEEATRVKGSIELRIAMQKGAVDSITSILGIHSFLVNFFTVYLQRNREEFVNLINMPYGHSVASRLAALQNKPLPTTPHYEQDQLLYGLKEVIDSKQLEVYRPGHVPDPHHRAVLAAFNEQLDSFRPYRPINGVPYPWDHSHRALTFYFVTDDNIGQVFEKAELAVLRHASLLCGLLLPGPHPLIAEHDSCREDRLIKQWASGLSFETDSETTTKLLLQLSSLICEVLLEESLLEMLPLF